MRAYRCLLVVLMIAAIGFGIWYCTFTYDEQRSIKDGTLVFKELERKGVTDIWEAGGEGKGVTDNGIY